MNSVRIIFSSTIKAMLNLMMMFYAYEEREHKKKAPRMRGFFVF
jgi:hypothetical protein